MTKHISMTLVGVFLALPEISMKDGLLFKEKDSSKLNLHIGTNS